MTAAWHAAWLLLLVPACFHPSYDHPACGPGGACPDGLTCNAQGICEAAGSPTSDAPVAIADAAIDASVPSFCDIAAPNVIACYQFEGDTTDGSPHHLDATMTNVAFAVGKVGKAMQFGATSVADAPDSPALDVAALTIEAWINPSQLPSSGNRAGIADVNGQYGLFLRSGGDLSCTVNGGPGVPVAKALVATNRWTHVACTYDGVAAAVIYADGIALVTANGNGSLNTSGNTGLSLAADNPTGSNGKLIGMIDEVRLLSVARTAAEICSDAGKLSCP